jgi:hypothetical protein
MRPAFIAAAGILAALPAAAQYVGQISTANKTAPDMRAVAVLEWTGDADHPKTSRLVPVCIFDGQQLQDAGVYLARPQPLALDTEVEYQLQRDGKTVGIFDVQSAGRQQDSWIGFGAWKPLPVARPKPSAESASSRRNPSVRDDDNSDRPTLHRRNHSGDTSSSGSGNSGSASTSQPPPDPDRPTLHRTDTSASTGDSTSSTGSTGTSTTSTTNDSDQPTLHRKDNGDSTTDTGSTNSSASSAPPPDPDRPTLHRSSGDESSTTSTDPDRPTLKKKKPSEEVAYVSSMSTDTDPNRPHLLRGKPADDTFTVSPTLVGLPAEMNQQVAVSDARNTPDHPWDFSWANPDDEAAMKSGLEDIARKALGLVPNLAPPPPPAAPAPRRTSAHTKNKLAPPPTPPPPPPLLDEQFRVFSLTYGSGATMVLSAHTAGSGADQKFITLIAQPDLYGNLLVLLKSVTDAAHLDDTPQMRLIDPVDAMADNRGELLFELRGATQRQFALYLVLRGQVSQLFVTGGSPSGPFSQ